MASRSINDIFTYIKRIQMIIYGVVLLAACYIIGQIIGEGLGILLGVDANIGGVGFAMLFLMLSTDWLQRRGYLGTDAEKGIQFWSQMYIPIIVAMAATQNVKAAVSSGMVAILAGIIPVAISFWAIPFLSKTFKKTEH